MEKISASIVKAKRGRMKYDSFSKQGIYYAGLFTSCVLEIIAVHFSKC